MYEYIDRGELEFSDQQRTEAVLDHQGTAADMLQRHARDAFRAVGEGMGAVRKLAPRLFERIADARTLRLAWDFLARKGGTAPGPDGLRYSHLSNSEVWDMCRCLAKAIRVDTYRTGPEKVLWVAKASGNGQRPIVLLNLQDRVVQRAIVLIVQPLLDPLFDDLSFGFRPRRSHLPALAAAQWLTTRESRYWWVCEDVKDAFCQVPLQRLLQVVKKYLPSDELLNLLQRVLPAQNLSGLRQGGSLSPLMLNVYLHHFLDRPWRQQYPKTPLIRVADDLLVLCRNRAEAKNVDAGLRRLLLPAGMPLKGKSSTSINNLKKGDTADWLGLHLSAKSGGLAMEIAEGSWKRLEGYLVAAHTKSDSPLRAIQTIKQWLDQKGPCYPWSSQEEVRQRIVTIANEQGFEEIPNAAQTQALWQRAYARWRRLLQRAQPPQAGATLSLNQEASSE